MQAGIDVGYSHTKAVSGNRRAHFPSVVGTPERSRFSLTDDGGIILTEPRHVAVGAGAVEQSRFLHRREDRRYIYSATVPHQEASRSALRKMMQTFFAGSTSKAVLAMLDMSDRKVSAEELDEIAKWIEEQRGSK